MIQRTRRRPACGRSVGCLAVCVSLLTSAWADDASRRQPDSSVHLTVSPGVMIRKPIKSYKELRDERIVRQKYDFSCGAAALTTILRHYYRLPVTEESVVNHIVKKRGMKDAVRRYREKKGFSLLDLKMAANAAGFHARAYKEMSILDLAELDAPAIIPIRTKQYDHFVVFRGLRGDRVHLTDPITGNITIKAANFAVAWRDGIGMVLEARNGAQPENWRPDRTRQGYVTREMTRSIITRSATPTITRGNNEF